MGMFNNDMKISRTALSGEDKKKNVFTAIADNTRTKSVQKSDIDEPAKGFGVKKIFRTIEGKEKPNTKTSADYIKQISKPLFLSVSKMMTKAKNKKQRTNTILGD